MVNITALEYFEYVLIQKHTKFHKPLEVNTCKVLGPEDEKHRTNMIKRDNLSLNRDFSSVELFRIAKECFKLCTDEK